MIELYWLLFIFSTALQVLALDVSQPPFDALRFSPEFLGIHNFVQDELETPPSRILTQWQFRLDDGKNKNPEMTNGCPKDSSICAITSRRSLEEDKSEEIIQLFSLTDDQISVRRDNDTIVCEWNEIAWGSFQASGELRFECSDDQTDSFEISNSSPFIQESNKIVWRYKEFCNKNDSTSPSDPKENTDEGMSRLTIMFLMLVVIFAGYLVAQAWYNTSTMGSSGDFFNELTDTVVENLSSIPRLLGEIISKITGSNNSTRGGYSAV